MDRATRSLSPEDQAARLAARAAYLDAVRDWVSTGRYALSPDRVGRRLPRATHEIASANAHFRLGIWLYRNGRSEEAAAEFAEASRLHPDSWTIWRQAADLRAVGEASGEAFWRRVEALGERPYYPAPDLSDTGG
jgi:hypothetical protein